MQITKDFLAMHGKVSHVAVLQYRRVPRLLLMDLNKCRLSRQKNKLLELLNKKQIHRPAIKTPARTPRSP